MAERFECPSWDGPGTCECGAELPPMKDWKNPYTDWSSTVCSTCGRGFVDEEEFIAIYDDLTDEDRADMAAVSQGDTDG